MDEEEINETPAPEAPEESTVEESAEESLDQILDEELTDKPVTEEEKTIIDDFDYEPESSSEKAEKPSIDESIEESVDIEPAEELVKDESAPVEEPQDETQTLAEEATPETPAEETTSEERTEGVISEQDLEAPNETGNTEPDVPTNPEDAAEQAQASPSETEEKPKSNKPLLFTIIIFLILAIGGAGIWYYLLNSKKTPTPPVQSDIETIEPIDNTGIEAISGDELSDFDLTFLRLNNNQDNLIYSPLSIKYALAMLSDATANESKAQIDALIGDYRPKAYLNSENRSLANAMFVRTDISSSIKSSYTDMLKDKYYADVISDPITSPDPLNAWVSDKTLGIIDKLFDESVNNNDFVLVNALAIDMKWVNRLMCITDETQSVPCKGYSPYFAHENYSHPIKTHASNINDFEKKPFNNSEATSATFATTANRYDIIKELGENYIRETIQAKYSEWLVDVQSRYENCPDCYSAAFDLDKYMEDLASNYNKISISTDYYFLNTDNEQLFAKNLQEYDGSTLQFVAIMPKLITLENYIKNTDAKSISALINKLSDASSANTYKDGVVTRLSAYFPFFDFGTNIPLKDNLQTLGVTDVFSANTADLTNMTDVPGSFITNAVHKADIEFTNDGIKAAAATAFMGGLGAAGGYEYFDYTWDVPIEDVELNFDKPFLFLIRDKNTGEVWFVGTVYNPSN